jgi:hypothetical protein
MKRVITISAILLALGMTCFAKDAIQASVTPTNGGTPIITANGNPYSVGTYGVGTIQLWYTVNALAFQPGELARFRLGLSDAHYSLNPQTAYPVSLNLGQIGSTDLILSSAPALFSPTGPGWNSSSEISISIPASTSQNPTLNVDGTELVGNLRLTTSPEGAHLDTVTNVQVHVKLVHPSNCIRVFEFITDESLTTVVSSTEVNVSRGKTPKVTSTNPYGQFSNNILIANTCAISHSFDLRALLDASFQTNPHDNPGNAVFTYQKSGYVDPASFNIAGFGTGTAKGQQLCLQNVNIPAGETFLAAIHMGIIKGVPPESLPLAAAMFGFSAEVYGAGSNCSGALDIQATPNPVSTKLTFSMK